MKLQLGQILPGPQIGVVPLHHVQRIEWLIYAERVVPWKLQHRAAACFIGEMDGRLKRVSEILPPENWQVWIVTHETFAPSPRIEFAIRTLKEALQAYPGLASTLNNPH